MKWTALLKVSSAEEGNRMKERSKVARWRREDYFKRGVCLFICWYYRVENKWRQCPQEGSIGGEVEVWSAFLRKAEEGRICKYGYRWELERGLCFPWDVGNYATWAEEAVWCTQDSEAKERAGWGQGEDCQAAVRTQLKPLAIDPWWHPANTVEVFSLTFKRREGGLLD